MSVDPLAKKLSLLSPYQFGSNSPLWLIDVEGLVGTVYTIVNDQRTGKTELKVNKDPSYDKNEYWIQNIDKNGNSTYTQVNTNTVTFKKEFSKYGLAGPLPSQKIAKEIEGKKKLKEDYKESSENSAEEARDAGQNASKSGSEKYEDGDYGYMVGQTVRSIIQGSKETKVEMEIKKLEAKKDSLEKDESEKEKAGKKDMDKKSIKKQREKGHF